MQPPKRQVIEEASLHSALMSLDVRLGELSIDPQIAAHPSTDLLEIFLDAARYNDFNTVKRLLTDASVNVNAVADVDENGNTALHLAAANGCIEVVRLLLESGADFNASNAAGNTALHWAALTNQLAVVKTLCEGGADPLRKNAQETLPVELAANYGHEEIIAFLVKFIEESNKQTQEAEASKPVPEVNQ